MIHDFTEKANWIFLPPDKFPDRQKCRKSFFAANETQNWTAALFRREFTLDEPGDLRAFIAAESCYRAWFDGQYWSDGPAETGGDYACGDLLEWAFYDELKLTGIPAGKHTVIIEVNSGNDLQCNYSAGQCGLKFALYSGENPLLFSDDKWLCQVDPSAYGPELYSFHEASPDKTWYTPAILPDELFSQRSYLKSELPELFTCREKPVRVFAPFEPERLLDADKFIAGISPLTVTAGEPFTCYFEFDGEFTGQPEISCRCKSGVMLRMTPQEILGRAPVERDCSTKVVSLPGEINIRCRRSCAIHYIKLEIDFGVIGMPGCSDLEITSLTAHRRHFPVDDTPFACSDKNYSILREACSNTLKMCMQKMHFDSPVHLEGLGCVGDYRFMALQSFYLFGEYRLARQDIIRISRMLIHSKGKLFHETFALIYFQMLRDYILYSGDTAIAGLPECLDARQLVLSRFRRMKNPDGIITEAPNFMFIDWSTCRSESLHHPSAGCGMGAMNAFFIIALQSEAEILRMTGEISAEKSVNDEIMEMQKLFLKFFFDRDAGCFISGIPGISGSKPHTFLPPDDLTLPPAHLPHTDILATVAGMMPDNVIGEIAGKTVTCAEKREIQPYFCNFLLEALWHKSEFFNLYADRLFDLFLKLLDTHKFSMRESWFGGDYCHAWSGTPAIWFGKAVLGVSPLAPGFAETLVMPIPGKLTHASGKIRTPHGEIEVSWQINGNNSEISIRHPEKIRIKTDLRHLPDCQLETDVY